MNPYWKQKKILGWALYDFANSAFATTVLAVIFNVYFVQRVVPPEGWGFLGLRAPGAALWGYTVSLSMLVTFVLAPLLGAAADHVRSKKAFLKWFWLLGVSASAGLFFVTPGRVGLAAGLFLLANIGFAGGNVFYNAFLPELCDRPAMGRVSGLGWAVGYLGGGLCLALNLLMLKSPGLFGLEAGNFLPVRASLLSVGLWWFVFALPFFRWVPEERRADQGAAPTPWAALGLGWKRLRETFGRAREHRNLFKFLAAYVLYNEGIETIILMASVFGAQALGMSQDELVLCFLMIQGVAFAGALIFGRLADHLRHKKTIGLTLAVYMAVIGWAYVMTSSRDFWILGVVVGLVLGGSQAASRSLMGLLTPPDRSAEFFSFYGVVGKLTAVLGPFVFGLASQLGGLRNGVLSLLVFFLAGGALLVFVEENPEAA